MQDLSKHDTSRLLLNGEQILLKVSRWKGVMHFGKKGKLAPRYVGPFEILERIGHVAYRLRLPKELSEVHKTLRFVKEPVKIFDREVKSLKPSRISIVQVCWNSKRVVKDEPWLLMGDFNVILDPSERPAGSSFVTSGMVDKAEFLPIVKDVWDPHVPGYIMFFVVSKLKLLKKPLRKLKFAQGDLTKKVFESKLELERVQSMMVNDSHNSALRKREIVCLNSYKDALRD
ncbi:hypothetical protein Tco_0966496 [Tanacetum coccineum]